MNTEETIDINPQQEIVRAVIHRLNDIDQLKEVADGEGVALYTGYKLEDGLLEFSIKIDFVTDKASLKDIMEYLLSKNTI